jgi:hypothetical protein
MRFGQTHGAGPFATGQVRQIHLLLLFGSVQNSALWPQMMLLAPEMLL